MALEIAIDLFGGIISNEMRIFLRINAASCAIDRYSILIFKFILNTLNMLWTNQRAVLAF